MRLANVVLSKRQGPVSGKGNSTLASLRQAVRNYGFLAASGKDMP